MQFGRLFRRAKTMCVCVCVRTYVPITILLSATNVIRFYHYYSYTRGE